FAFPDELSGQTVRCKSCQSTFDVEPDVVGEARPVEARRVEARPARREQRLQEKPRLVAAPPPTVRAVDDDRPRPAPRRRSRPVESSGRGPLLAILLVIGGIGALILVSGLGMGAYGFVGLKG